MTHSVLVLVKVAQRLTLSSFEQIAAVLGDTIQIDGFRALELNESYLYCNNINKDSLPALHKTLNVLSTQWPITAIRRLEALCCIDGASMGSTAPWHYIVETDVLPAAEDDLNQWYDQEHMPGLAAVPGTVLARRFRSDADSPRYHACYDLAALEAFNSPAWLAVRATDWSSRVRPSFRNTKRTMFERINSIV